MDQVHLTEQMFTSRSDEWETPQDFFDRLAAEFPFTLDAAATPANAKCAQFWTKEDDALTQDWPGLVWCNPPYGHQIGAWVQKAWEEAQKGSTVVVLVPSRTDTRWWHDHVMRAYEIRLVKGRLKFVGAKSSAPFPSAVVIFEPGLHCPLPAVMRARQ